MWVLGYSSGGKGVVFERGLQRKEKSRKYGRL